MSPYLRDMVLLRSLFLGIAMLYVPEALISACRADQPAAAPGLLERIMHPDGRAKSQFQNKVFRPGGVFSTKVFTTGEFRTGDYRSEKSFFSKSFAGAKEALLGKKSLSRTSLPEKYSQQNTSLTKTFATGEYGAKSYADAGKSYPYASTVYSTREFAVKGKAQGGLDNDPKLSEAVRKGLSFDDVRNLLNKGP